MENKLLIFEIKEIFSIIETQVEAESWLWTFLWEQNKRPSMGEIHFTKSSVFQRIHSVLADYSEHTVVNFTTFWQFTSCVYTLKSTCYDYSVLQLWKPRWGSRVFFSRTNLEYIYMWSNFHFQCYKMRKSQVKFLFVENTTLGQWHRHMINLHLGNLLFFFFYEPFNYVDTISQLKLYQQ